MNLINKNKITPKFVYEFAASRVSVEANNILSIIYDNIKSISSVSTVKEDFEAASKQELYNLYIALLKKKQ